MRIFFLILFIMATLILSLSLPVFSQDKTEYQGVSANKPVAEEINLMAEIVARIQGVAMVTGKDGAVDCNKPTSEICTAPNKGADTRALKHQSLIGAIDPMDKSGGL